MDRNEILNESSIRLHSEEKVDTSILGKQVLDEMSNTLFTD